MEEVEACRRRRRRRGDLAAALLLHFPVGTTTQLNFVYPSIGFTTDRGFIYIHIYIERMVFLIFYDEGLGVCGT